MVAHSSSRTDARGPRAIGTLVAAQNAARRMTVVRGASSVAPK
jgi:hypothetical protein